MLLSTAIFLTNLLNFALLSGSPATQKTPTKKAGGDNSLWANTSQQDATNALAHLGVASLAANPVSSFTFANISCLGSY